ncbi:MAG: 4-hydroxy-tetrahydrodipicolinate synthase [Alphaproteobacteria bacterium]|nr:4-hydroxy-tetrahydrodipicolinate synthase [Alphaproteobacteria bacterium]
MFRGSITALITPFKGSAVDEAAFERLVDWQIKEGSEGLVPMGTTGESPTLTHEEHCRVTEICVSVTAGRVPVIAGTGSNSTDEAIAFCRHAERVGSDGVLSVTGYYNKPGPAGLIAHYKAVTAATDLPLLLYNIPARAVIDISVETMVAIREAAPRVIGVKDATADLGRVTAIRAALGEDFVQLSGEDITALGYNAHGGMGCISVTANVAPKLCAKFQTATLRGDFATALEIQDKLGPLHMALFLEPSPAGIKYAASRLGLCAPDVRLPLVGVSPPVASAIDEAMQFAGLV